MTRLRRGFGGRVRRAHPNAVVSPGRRNAVRAGWNEGLARPAALSDR